MRKITISILKFLFLTTFSLICWTSLLFSQTLFQKAYGVHIASNLLNPDYYDNYGTEMIRINDNKFIVAGYYYPLVLDNGGIQVPGVRNDGYLSCIDSLGNSIWSKSYGDFGTREDHFNVAKQSIDGGILAAGYTNVDGSYGQNDLFIVKTDSDGALIWSKKIDLGDHESINGIEEDSDGSIYCLTGSKLVKLTSLGQVTWEKEYQVNSLTSSFHSLSILTSGNIVLAGSIFDINSFTTKAILIKIDINGDVIWTNSYIGDQQPYTDMFWDKVISLDNDEFAVNGRVYYNDGNTILAKFDHLGTVSWAKRSNTDNSSPSSVGNSGFALSPDKKYFYLAGYHHYHSNNRKANLSKFTLGGTYLWEKEFGACFWDAFASLAFGDKSSVYLMGYTNSYGQMTTSTYLVRSDSSGYTSCYDDDITNGYINFSMTKAAGIPTVSTLLGHSSIGYSNPAISFNFSDSLVCTSQNPEGVYFNADDTLVCAGTSVSFFDHSVTDQGLSWTNYTTISGDQMSVLPTYKWIFSGGNPSGSTDQNPSGIVYSAPGKYDVTLIVTMGCVMDTLVLEDYIEVISSTPNLVISGDSSLCGGGTAQLVVSGAKTYSWLPTTGLNDPTSDTISATPTQTTTYTVTGSLGGSCIGTKDVTVTVGNAVTAGAGANDTICSGESTTLTGSGGQTFTWSSNETTRTITVSPVTTTDYIFTAIDGSCDDVDTVQVVVNESPTVTLTPAGTTIAEGGSVNLEATGGGTYAWLPTLGLSCSDCATPVAIPTSTTNYCVTVTSTSGCKVEKCVNITVNIQCGELFIPNSFSPNGDGNNDKLEVKINAACVAEYTIQIYDRWGEMIFTTDKITESWDGKFDGKDLDNAVFVYYLKMKLVNSTNEIEKKGNVSIIK